MLSFIKKIDWKLALACALLIAGGLLSLLSTAQDLFFKQIAWIILGLFIALILTYVDLRSFFSRKSVIFGIYSIVISLLVITFFLAPKIKGNRAWILIGPFQFQPSELAKVALILVLAYFFSKRHIGIASWRTIITSFIYSIIPAGLVALQPDMGSALVIMAIWVGFVLVSGMPLKKILIAALFAGLAFGVMWTSVLKDYQKERVVGLFTPSRDPLGINYNVIQSKIAIGSGGFLGKGFKQGTQVQLGFLPEAQTDFIFAAIGEEGGFLGITLIFIAFLWMNMRILKIGALVDGNFYKFLCLGTTTLFLIQFIFHIGSNLGFLPVVGVTLPFVSYGGSSMLASMMLVGMIQSAYSKK